MFFCNYSELSRPFMTNYIYTFIFSYYLRLHYIDCFKNKLTQY